MDILNTSMILMAMGKSLLYKEDQLDRIADHILHLHKEKIFYEEDALPELVNIV